MEIPHAADGPPYPAPVAEVQFPRISRNWARQWAKRGLSRVCTLCRVLTPAEHCKTKLPDTEGLACRKCMDSDQNRRLPMPGAMPLELRNLTYLEKRLISFMRVNECLLDLPTNHVPGQYGRVYVTPLEKPDACNILKDATFENGRIFITFAGKREERPTPVRPRKLAQALLHLKANHPRYSCTPEIKSEVETAIANLLLIDQDENDPEHPAAEVQHNALTYGGPPPPDAILTELKKAHGHARLEPGIDVIVFPHLFPDGNGGFPGLQACKLPEYCRQRLLGEDARFQQDPQYIFWLLEAWFKHKVSSNTQVMVGPSSLSRLYHTQQKIRQAAYTTLRQVPGTQPYIYAKRSMALSMIEQLGKPKWFLTLTCHARQPAMLLACIIASLRTEHQMTLSPPDEVLDRALNILDDYLRHDDTKWPIGDSMIPARSPSELCNDFPAVVAREFMRQVRALMRWLGAETEVEADMQEAIFDEMQPVETVKDPPSTPFRIKDFTMRVEWQKRGDPRA